MLKHQCFTYFGRTAFIILASLVSCVCSCTSVEEPRHSFEIGVEDGIVTAHSSAIPKYEGELFRFTHVYDVQEDERPESLFIGADLPVRDERGYSFVTMGTWTESWIAVYDSTGRYQYSFGQRGEGPGDFGSPRISIIRDGEVHVFDPSLYRYNRFTTDGNLIDLFPIPKSAEWGSPQQGGRIDGGGHIVIYRKTEFGADNSFEKYYAALYSKSWESIITINTPRLVTGETQEWRSGGSTLVGNRPLPFRPKACISFHPQYGIVSINGTDPVVNRYSLSGEHTLRIVIDLHPEPVTALNKQLYEAPLRKQASSGSPQFRREYQERLDQLEYPDIIPYWGWSYGNSASIDNHGFIWLRFPEYTEHGGSYLTGFRYMVLSAEGEYLGNSQLPPGFTSFDGNQIVVFYRDEGTEELSISYYNIEPRIRGLNHY